ncbi:carboxypeptidase-like regulatory domain-containing protein [Mucilaginibacter flavidus]|uniref:carboxypeptidase-like regulatory domain-containing protein n=1 Tax=Mucilaginibacter flavidus TaxID=2949309 RepID=UPI002092AA56|nr:TonB-dependent receptor [Mucilaginibacter flavidus]MCO5945869.1 TonB-dependent receptor [Mucilaginibacter flavidus]
MIKRLLFLCFLLPCLAFGQAGKDSIFQNNLHKNIAATLNAFTANHPIEKAYLQFDKPYYAIGDTIYFKAYVTISAQHKLSAMSGILNAELISPDNKIARSLKLQMIAGVAWGDFTLTDTLKGGNYRVRAYTNWMRSEGETAFFEQALPVGSAFAARIPESGQPKNRKAVANITAKKFDVQFMPERGSQVGGNYSKIAFKAIAPGGLGTDITGTIKDETGLEICKFASSHLGIGSFNLVPEVGKTYKADITYADGTTSVIDLPKAVSNGYTISLNNNNPDTVRIRITAGNEATAGKLSLVAQAGGVVYYAAEKQGDSKIFSAAIPKSKFPTGIIQFTLFSQNDEPLNERLVFINHHDQLKLNLKADKQEYTIRHKVKLNLSPKDKDGKPVTGSFSVAVTDETKVAVDSLNENTILTNLLLTSELKGNIAQPSYYFASADEKTQIDLDNLMLTQGYRHFDWKKILSDTVATNIYQPEKAMQVSGTVKRNGKPVPGAQVKLFSKAGGMFMLDTLTDVHGKFAFKDLLFADSTKFIVQSKLKKGQDDVTLELDTIQPPRVTIDKFGSGKYLQTSVSAADISTYVINQKQFYEEQQKYGINKHPIILKGVKVEAKYEPKIPHSENLNGSGNADYVFTSKDIEKFNCARLAECLSGRLPGLRFRNGIPESMAVVIDGNFVDVDLFTSINPDDIEGIEIILGPHYAAIYGTRMANGGIIITTKRGKRTKDYYRYAPGVVTYMPKGFYKVREFYSPQYDNPHTNQKMADLRSTIYWNPNIITDKDGKASFEYFNADGKGTYRVVVEGIDADGNLGRQVFRYKVE